MEEELRVQVENFNKKQINCLTEGWLQSMSRGDSPYIVFQDEYPQVPVPANVLQPAQRSWVRLAVVRGRAADYVWRYVVKNPMSGKWDELHHYDPSACPDMPDLTHVYQGWHTELHDSSTEHMLRQATECSSTRCPHCQCGWTNGPPLTSLEALQRYGQEERQLQQQQVAADVAAHQFAHNLRGPDETLSDIRNNYPDDDIDESCFELTDTPEHEEGVETPQDTSDDTVIIEIDADLIDELPFIIPFGQEASLPADQPYQLVTLYIGHAVDNADDVNDADDISPPSYLAAMNDLSINDDEAALFA